MKLSDLFETEYGMDDATNCDDNSAANETGNLARRDAEKKVTMTGRGTNYKKASRIVGRAKLAKKDSVDVRDDTTEQHGQNYSSMQFRR